MNGWSIEGVMLDVPISLILVFALGSIGIYGFIVGGWASESKYSLLGADAHVRAARLLRGVARARVLGVVLMGQSLQLTHIVAKQEATLWFVIPQFVGFLTFMVGGIAETSRPPFDLPEADTELVAGYSTEYSGMRWGLFQMAEYVNLIVLSGLAMTLFFGGWHFPWVDVARQLRPDLVLPQAPALRLGLHLDPRLAAAPALRPADAPRLEGPAAGRDAQRARHRLLRGARSS